MLGDPVLLQQEPLPLWQATVDPCLRRRHSTTQSQIWFSLCVVSGPCCAQGLLELSQHVWSIGGLILNAISPSYYLAGASLPFDMGNLFLVGSNILLQVLFSGKLQFWSSHRINYHTSFQSTIFHLASYGLLIINNISTESQPWQKYKDLGNQMGDLSAHKT